MKRALLLLACSVSSCLLPRVEIDQSLGSGGEQASGGASAGTSSAGTSSAGTSRGGAAAGAASSAGASAVGGRLHNADGGTSEAGVSGGGVAPAGGSSGVAGKSGHGGGSNSSGSGSGGSGGVGGSYGSGGVSGRAGAGSGGAGQAGGVGQAGGTGSAGADACGGLTRSAADQNCCVAYGSAGELAIDDLEDGDHVTLAVGKRLGYWFTYNVGSVTQTPPATGTSPFPPTAGNGHSCSLSPAPPACAGLSSGTAYFAGTFGSIAPATSGNVAGIGVEFNDRLGKACPYGASTFHGISFWAKGSIAFRAIVTTSATTPASYGGSCLSTSTCLDHYSMLVTPPADGTTWKQFTITFSDSVNFKQQGWGTPVSFDANSLLSLEFQVDGSQTATTAFNIGVDDLAFVP